ncbi:unnamed protein product [Acanthoscelides obtectus]|uniref:Uncharacterized protein n=1 Tax=Acanthoscelides obtectus TaxID=200917 RepID=A0A9P0L761_ACAOB|nr:unnamed protein product [Acanthoscelides obtectus]CAK1638959.1 hypothetical protein AOBTE_LOCUS10907 [Acanthoscelides obtectus]
MEKIATENLFLLEFLVDEVDIDPKRDSDAPGEICVSFQFLDNAPLDVCEADCNPQRNYKLDSEDVKSGKSCLFSLSPEQAIEATKQFDILVNVCKKMQPGWLPERLDLGASLINIANLFNELIDSVETSDGATPTAKTLKDTFDITTQDGTPIGKLGVYIRMSCFGKLIVTQFQMNLQDKSVLFKDKEGKSLYRYKKAGKGSKKGGSSAGQTSPIRGNQQCPTIPCGPQGTAMAMEMSTALAAGIGGARKSSCPTTPCAPGGGPVGGPGAMGGMGQPGMGMSGMPGMGIMPGLDGERGGAPCNECGGFTDAQCIQGGMMGGMRMGGMGPMGGFGMGGGGYPNTMLPCMECGSLPYAPCMPPGMSVGMGMHMGGFGGMPPGSPRSQTPWSECANEINAPCQEEPEPPKGNYQEIGASMGGNSLTIRVHKDKNKVEQVDPNAQMSMTVNEPDDGCSCVMGRPGKKKKQEQVIHMQPGVQQVGPIIKTRSKRNSCKVDCIC